MKTINHHLQTLTLIVGCSLPFVATATTPVQYDDLNKISITSSMMRFDDYQQQQTTRMYPKPQQGMVQHILTLPALADEPLYMLEVQIGQNKLVDCNKVRLMGEIQLLTVESWGHPYYQVDSVMQGPTTKMMCTNAKTAQFVQLNDSIKLNYDSQLAKVFYLPEGTDLRYRLWKVAQQYRFSGQ